jgi:hypothetical protein
MRGPDSQQHPTSRVTRGCWYYFVTVSDDTSCCFSGQQDAPAVAHAVFQYDRLLTATSPWRPLALPSVETGTTEGDGGTTGKPPDPRRWQQRRAEAEARDPLSRERTGQQGSTGGRGGVIINRAPALLHATGGRGVVLEPGRPPGRLRCAPVTAHRPAKGRGPGSGSPCARKARRSPRRCFGPVRRCAPCGEF